MFPRDTFKVHTDAMTAEHRRQAELRGEAAAAREQRAVVNITWGQGESSMISHEHLHVAHNMIARLKGRYGSEYARRGMQQIIETEIAPFIEKLITKARDDHDETKIKQYEAALRAITSRDSHLHKDRNVSVFGNNLRELLAYIWIAARDTNALLRLQHERTLMKIADPKERETKREEIVNDSVVNCLVFGLNEIRTAHNEDDIEPWMHQFGMARNENEDSQSCVPGTFGRLVLSCCPHNAVTILTEDNMTQAEIDDSIRVSAVSAEEVNYQSVVNQIANYVALQLQTAEDPATREAAFHFLTTYMTGIDEDDPDAAKEMRQYDRAKARFNEFLEYLENTSKKGLMRHLELNIPGIDAVHNRERIVEVYKLFLDAMKPENLEKKDFAMEVYANEEDRNYIERIRKIGAAVSQTNQFRSVLSGNNEINDLRLKIRLLYMQLNALENISKNAVKHYLLAHSGDMRLSATALDRVNAQVVKELQYCRDIYMAQIKPNIDLYKDRLHELVDSTINASRRGVEINVGFDTLLTATQLDAIKAEATNRSRLTDATIEGLERLVNAFGEAKSPRQNDGLLQQVDLPDNIQLRTPAIWARHIIDVAHSSLHDKNREMKYIKRLIKKACSPEMQAAIKKEIGKQFNAYRNDHPDVDWNARREALHMIKKTFPKNSMAELGLAHQELLNLQDLTKEGDVLLGAETAKKVLDAGQCSLLLFKTNGYDFLETTDKETFKQQCKQWCDCAHQLVTDLKVPMEQLLGADKSQAHELNRQKLTQLVILTVFQNLGLTDIRKADVEAIKWLCDLYLNTKAQVGAGGGPMVNLSAKDTLEDRINFLNMHLSLMLTSLSSVSALYNTGLVRILDANAADKLINDTGCAINQCQVRSSTSTPTSLSMTAKKASGSGHTKLLKGRGELIELQTFKVEAGYFPAVKNEAFEFHLLNQNGHLAKTLCNSSNPACSLVSYDSCMQSVKRMRDVAYSEVSQKRNGYFVPGMGEDLAEQVETKVVATVQTRKPVAFRRAEPSEPGAARGGFFTRRGPRDNNMPQSNANSNNDKPSQNDNNAKDDGKPKKR